MFILATNNSHDFMHVKFLQDNLLSSFIQIHCLKEIPEICDPKTPCYFMDISKILLITSAYIVTTRCLN